MRQYLPCQLSCDYSCHHGTCIEPHAGHHEWGQQHHPLYPIYQQWKEVPYFLEDQITLYYHSFFAQSSVYELTVGHDTA